MGKYEQDDTTPAVTDGAPARDRDHLWVLALIAVCVLIEVWASWILLGSLSGFPKIGGSKGFPTDWTLAVTTEAYWGYALYAWLAASAGHRSREFAKWSAAGVFLLSLVGQGAAHLLKPGTAPAPALVVFVSSLPVIVLALIAVLVHLRQADREEAAAAWRKAKEAEAAAETARAEADERASLRRENAALSAARDADVSVFQARLDEAASALASAQQETAQALRRAEALERKLAAGDKPKPRKTAAADPAKSTREAGGDGDISTELAAYMELRANPNLRKPRMGGELARAVGVSGATARRYRDKFLNSDGSLKELSDESLTGSLTEGEA